MTTEKPFYLTEPYKEARQKAQNDLDNWPDDGSTYRHFVDCDWLEPKPSRRILWLCIFLSVVVVLSWIVALWI